jgi:hypothetical protein
LKGTKEGEEIKVLGHTWSTTFENALRFNLKEARQVLLALLKQNPTAEIMPSDDLKPIKPKR